MYRIKNQLRRARIVPHSEFGTDNTFTKGEWWIHHTTITNLLLWWDSNISLLWLQSHNHSGSEPSASRHIVRSNFFDLVCELNRKLLGKQCEIILFSFITLPCWLLKSNRLRLNCHHCSNRKFSVIENNEDYNNMLRKCNLHKICIPRSHAELYRS